MPDFQTKGSDDVLELLIAQGPEAMATTFTSLFNLAMRFERENFLGAHHYERSENRRGYANGVKPKRVDAPAGTDEKWATSTQPYINWKSQTP